MAGLFAISVNPEVYKDDFLSQLFLGTFYQQPLGTGYAGLSTYSSVRKTEKIKTRTHRGHFRDVFSNDMVGLEGTEGIGYCGPVREPFFEDSRLGEFSICFSGNIINRVELVERFKSFGHVFSRGGDDIEIIAKLIAQGANPIDGIKKMTKEIKGSYVLLMLTSEGIYVARSPDGRWSLVIGEKNGATIVATESGGFDNLRLIYPTPFSEPNLDYTGIDLKLSESGFELVRDVAPGEIGLLENGRYETKEIMESEFIQGCSFLSIYTSFPNAVIEGRPSSDVRKKLCARLARKDIENGLIPDRIIPVPDSGRFHAIGYKEEFDRQVNAGNISRTPLYDESLLKFSFAFRSFFSSEKIFRDLEAFIKMLSSGEKYINRYVGEILLVVDDSLVRGTQTRLNLIPKLWRLGFKEIHFRFAFPQIFSHCPWGKTTKKGETLATIMPSKEQIAKYLGVTSVDFSTIDSLVEAHGVPREKLCVDCCFPEKAD